MKSSQTVGKLLDCVISAMGTATCDKCSEYWMRLESARELASLLKNDEIALASAGDMKDIYADIYQAITQALKSQPIKDVQ